MKMIEEAIGFAKEQSRAIVESGEEHQPIMLILTPKGANVMPLKDMDKDMFKPFVSHLLRQLDAYAYILINEAWVAKLPKDSPTIQRVFRGEISVSELPPDDREEILTIMAAENRKSYHLWFARIRYTSEGKRYLGEWNKSEGVPEGRLILKEW